jgi:hypothetical protein
VAMTVSGKSSMGLTTWLARMTSSDVSSNAFKIVIPVAILSCAFALVTGFSDEV